MTPTVPAVPVRQAYRPPPRPDKALLRFVVFLSETKRNTPIPPRKDFAVRHAHHRGTRTQFQALFAGAGLDQSGASKMLDEKVAALRSGSPEVAPAADFFDNLNPAQQKKVREFMEKGAGAGSVMDVRGSARQGTETLRNDRAACPPFMICHARTLPIDDDEHLAAPLASYFAGARGH